MKRFENSWTYGDFRPRIESCGINKKTAWIQIEYKGNIFGGKVSKALVKMLEKIK